MARLARSPAPVPGSPQAGQRRTARRAQTPGLARVPAVALEAPRAAPPPGCPKKRLADAGRGWRVRTKASDPAPGSCPSVLPAPWGGAGPGVAGVPCLRELSEDVRSVGIGTGPPTYFGGAGSPRAVTARGLRLPIPAVDPLTEESSHLSHFFPPNLPPLPPRSPGRGASAPRPALLRPRPPPRPPWPPPSLSAWKAWVWDP